jgi:hypothetical protein
MTQKRYETVNKHKEDDQKADGFATVCKDDRKQGHNDLLAAPARLELQFLKKDRDLAHHNAFGYSTE